MAAVARARKDALAPHLSPDHVGIASINSPMQCMMKEVCAQCLQKHVDPATGREEIVFSCFNQDQKLDEMDWGNLAARLRQNTVSEKLTNLWMDRLFRLEDPRASRLRRSPRARPLAAREVPTRDRGSRRASRSAAGSDARSSAVRHPLTAREESPDRSEGGGSRRGSRSAARDQANGRADRRAARRCAVRRRSRAKRRRRLGYRRPGTAGTD